MLQPPPTKTLPTARLNLLLSVARINSRNHIDNYEFKIALIGLSSTKSAFSPLNVVGRSPAKDFYISPVVIFWHILKTAINKNVL